MNYSDDLHERRNLNIMAIIVIVFNVGCATFDNGEAKLMLINIHFHNMLGLKVIAYFMLCWFLFRYWIVSKDEYLKLYRDDLASINILKLCKKYIGNPNFQASELYLRRGRRYSKDVYIISDAAGTNRSSDIGWHNVRNVKRYLTIMHLFSKPTISTYLAPYLLFCIAILSSVSVYLCKSAG